MRKISDEDFKRGIELYEEAKLKAHQKQSNLNGAVWIVILVTALIFAVFTS